MKRFTVLFSAAVLSSANAQTLTQIIHEPQVGDVEKVRQLDTSAFASGLPNTTSGQNVVWNFSSAKALNTLTVSNNYVAPSTFTHGTLFAGATILQDMPGDMFTYFKSASTPTTQTELV